MSAAVLCFNCGCAGRSDEMQYFNHDGGSGYTCEGCQQEIKEETHGMYLQFLALCEKHKTEGNPKPIEL
jgi:hypothetical protein